MLHTSCVHVLVNVTSFPAGKSSLRLDSGSETRNDVASRAVVLFSLGAVDEKLALRTFVSPLAHPARPATHMATHYLGRTCPTSNH